MKAGYFARYLAAALVVRFLRTTSAPPQTPSDVPSSRTGTPQVVIVFRSNGLLRV